MQKILAQLLDKLKDLKRFLPKLPQGAGTMGKKLKVIIIALISLLLVSLIIIINLSGKNSKILSESESIKLKLVEERKELKQKWDHIVAERRNIQNRLESLRMDNEQLISQRDEIKYKYEQVIDEREGLLAKLGSFSRIEDDSVYFKQQNEKLKVAIEELNEDSSLLKSQINKLKRGNKQLRQELQEVEDSPKASSAGAVDAREYAATAAQIPAGVRSVDLPPIIVSPRGTQSQVVPVIAQQQSPFSLRGEILNVSKEYNFVVVDLGRNMKLRQGMIFEVFRQDQLLGKIEVIQVRSEISACDIIQAYSPFKVGDTVRY